MRVQMYQRPPTVAIASAMMLHPSYSFVVPSFDHGQETQDSESNEPFDFSINRELLINPNDVVLGDMIGEGGNSVVYKGLFKNRVLVAVKILQPSRTSVVTMEQKEKFQKEVLLLSKIKHENIAKFVGACIEPQLMIVTELLEGGTLQKFLWNSRPTTLDLKMSISFALDIARAMEYVHSNGIIHRDLKPTNMLMTGDQTQVKLADFGNAREETTDGMTNEAGTYRWMAPEVFSREPLRNGEKLYYDHKADVYSFALVLWELLTNETPFSGTGGMFVAYMIKQNQRPSLETIPEGAVSILESCWAEDPNARPEFKEIIVLLTNFLESFCSDSICAATKSSQGANLDNIENSETNLNEINNFETRKLEKKKKKAVMKKKVAKIILPFFKMFKACLSKS